MKRWWLVGALLLSLGANIGILAGRAWQSRSNSAAPTAGSPTPTADRPLPFVHRMANQLGLTGDRRAAFVERQRLFFEQTVQARARVARLQGELRRELVAEDPDRGAIDDLLEQVTAAHLALERVFVDNLLDTRELLDPGQERRYMRFLQRLRRSREDLRRPLRDRFPRPRNRPAKDRPG